MGGRFVLADDHTLVRAGLRALLQHLGMEVVAEASDGREAIAAAKAHRPDMVLMDISMPGLNGLEAISRVLDECPGTRVIILSMHASDEYARQAFRLGASAYLVKDSAVEELQHAIDAVLAGRSYVSAQLAQGGMDAGAQVPFATLDRLTPRQREVLQLIAEGRTTKGIARELGVSVKTAETHRTQLMERLNIHDVAGLVRFAIRAGLAASDR